MNRAENQQTDVIHLCDVAQIRYGLGQPPVIDPEGVPMIRATDVKSGRIMSDRVMRVQRDSIPLQRRPFLEKGDIIVVRSGAYTGDVAMYDGRWSEAIAGYDLIVSPNERQIASEFLCFYLLGEIAQRSFRSRRDRAAQPHLNAEQLRNTPVIVPPLEEQNAIADVLRAVRNAKDARERECSLERERKAALIDHIFRCGMRSEALRRSELGRIPESWSVKPLREIVNIRRGHDLPTNLRRDGKIPVVGSNGIVGWHDEFSDKVPVPGLTIGRSGSVGALTFVSEPFWPLNTVLYADNFHENHPKFVYYWLTLFDFKRYAQGVSVPTLNRNLILPILLPLPTRGEQEEIESLLSACDAKISALEREITLHDELFRAMLEELMSGRLSALPLVEHAEPVA